MKIFNWIFYRKSRIEKILQMLGGTSDDIEVAKELLLPTKVKKEEETYPKYRIWVTYGKVMLQRQAYSGDNWDTKDSDFYNSEDRKKFYIEKYKSSIVHFRAEDEKEKIRKAFKEYSINV